MTPVPVSQTPGPRSHAARFIRIDVLRAIAAVTVVAYHFFGSKIGWHLPWRADGLADFSAPLSSTIPLLGLSVGWAGVPLFFALSGFCIHGAFVRQPHFDAGVFFWRRFWRIYPPFLAAIALFCFWPIWRLGTDVSFADLAGHLTTSFVLTPHDFWSGLNPSFWSVAVEFQCYLLYPLFLLLRSRWGTARVALTWFVLGAIGKITASAFAGWPDHAINFWSCVSIFSFGDWALGALVAEDIATQKHRGFYRIPILIAAIIACLLSILWRPSLTLSFSLTAAAGALLIYHYACRATPVSRSEALLARLGVASYSLYLWHQPLLGPLESIGRDLSSIFPLQVARITTVLVIAIGLTAISFVSYYLLERTGIALAGRFRGKPTPVRS
ncbi:MAG: acyltransferase [Nibricoccus sp.]